MLAPRDSLTGVSDIDHTDGEGYDTPTKASGQVGWLLLVGNQVGSCKIRVYLVGSL